MKRGFTVELNTKSFNRLSFIFQRLGYLNSGYALAMLYLYCISFLVACTRLYTLLCPSVHWSVGLSGFYFFINFVSLSHFKLYKSISHSESFLVLVNVSLA